MTRDEFIYGLKACGFTVKDGQTFYAEDDLIKCMDDLYFKTQPQDGDTISRQALLEKKWDVLFDGKYIQVVDVGDIEEAPSIQPQDIPTHYGNDDLIHRETARRIISSPRTQEQMLMVLASAESVEPKDREPMYYPQVDGITPTVIQPMHKHIENTLDCVGDRAVSLNAVNEIWHTRYSDIRIENEEEQYKRIQMLPSVEPQEGEWITHIKSDLRDDMWPTNPKCSKCGGEPYYSNTIYNYKFCPFCGAKMNGGDTECKR